jgi:hypothetical protein
MIARTAFFAAWFALFVVGCDESEPRDYAPPDYVPGAQSSVPEVEVCALFAVNACAAIAPCCNASPYPFDPSKCAAVVRGLCEARRSTARP